MVRTLKLSNVVSGSYYNLSQGIFDTIYFEKQTVTSPEFLKTKPLFIQIHQPVFLMFPLVQM